MSEEKKPRRIPKWEKPFLELYAKTGQITASIESLGMNRGTYHLHKNECPEFAELVEKARNDFINYLEELAFKGLQGKYDDPDKILKYLTKLNRNYKEEDKDVITINNNVITVVDIWQDI